MTLTQRPPHKSAQWRRSFRGPPRVRVAIPKVENVFRRNLAPYTQKCPQLALAMPRMPVAENLLSIPKQVYLGVHPPGMGGRAGWDLSASSGSFGAAERLPGRLSFSHR